MKNNKGRIWLQEDRLFSITKLFIMDSGLKKGKERAKEFKSGKMVASMKASGATIKRMVRAD